LVTHESTRAVGFTGSHKGGRALFDAANLRPDPIPVFAEMSSLNPVFILADTLRLNGPLIASGLKNSLTLGVGQFCTKPGIIIGIAGADMEAFKSKLCLEIQDSAAGTMLHEGIRSQFSNALATALKSNTVQVLARSKCVLKGTETEALPTLLGTTGERFLANPLLQEEIFGPAGLLVEVRDEHELLEVAKQLAGQLTATVHGTRSDLAQAKSLLSILERKAGRVLINGFPTGVEVSPAMQHGGPYPSSTDSRFSSVGTAAIQRWVRPVCFQNFPNELLPSELQDANPLGVMRLLNGTLTRDSIE